MVDTKKYKSLDACKERLDVYLENNLPVPPELQEAIDYWKKKESPISTSDNEYFYKTFIKNSKFEVKQDKIDCIRQTVDKLLEEGENAKEPGLLLGKIQCGKTDTFEAIICLAFDRGIDISVVFTKGTRTLAAQTIKRLKEDFRPFAKNRKIGSKSIYIYDILDIYESLTEARINKDKIVIVCKKEKTNLDHLIELFEKNLPVLKDKKVLIVDDEADFASINFKRVNGSEASGIDLAKISAQIEKFKKVPKYCRYLEVTATPYALYLQPTGEIKIINGFAQTARPRFTSLVPAHEMYIGGEQYFEESEKEDSMYKYLFHAIDKRCMSELAKADNSNLRLGIRKGEIYDLTEALISYFVAVAIRSIQVRNEKDEVYLTAALFHLDINQAQHKAQEQLILKMVDTDLKKVFLEDKDRKNRIVWNAVDYFIDEDFKESNENGHKEGLISVDFPEKEEIIDEICKIFKEVEYDVKIVNSNEKMSKYLDPDTGELELTHKATIFIGGSILDRGITVKNMLCFFYGRNPKVFQQDTVLQHARMYGARSKEDMAVTRFHTTMRIYDIMKRIHKRDSQLREWIKTGKDVDYNNAYFLTYDKDCKPCATSKIRASNAITLRGGSRFLPRGFFTKSNADIKDIVAKIDNIIESLPNYIEEGYFEMDQSTVFKILELIESTYLYDKKYENLEQEDDMHEVLSAAIHCGEKSGGKFSVIVKTNREANRILQNGAWADAPYTGAEHQESVQIAENNKMPVLMLFREKGEKCLKDRKSEAFKETTPKNIGWNDAPFYWPVLFAQPNLESVMFAINQRPDDDSAPFVEREDILKGINPEEVLKLTYKYDLIDNFGKEGRVYDPADEIYDDPYETRAINENTASRYLIKTTDGKGYKMKPGITIDKKHDHGLYSYNNGEFPFVLRPFKYMLLTKGRTGGCEQMLLKLTDPKYWHINPSLTFSDDGDMVDFISGDVIYGVKETVLSKNMRLRERFLSDVCQWTISYQVQEVLKYLPKVKVDNIDTEDDE